MARFLRIWHSVEAAGIRSAGQRSVTCPVHSLHVCTPVLLMILRANDACYTDISEGAGRTVLQTLISHT